MKVQWSIGILVGIGICTPTLVSAVSGFAEGGSAVAVALPVEASQIAYGDLIAYDQENGVYILSQYVDDPRIYGVAVKNPPVIIFNDPADVPVMRTGSVLVNVTVENGPIAPGDGIIASSIAGKGMRAAQKGTHIVGYAREAFSDTSSTTPLTSGGKTYSAGTIIVDLLESVSGASGTSTTIAFGQFECVEGSFGCNVLKKIDATPLVTLMRYVIAVTIALGSLYLAFRSFMTNSVNGVISVGRNPRAKGAIQAMVIFNAVLAVGIAVAGLAVGLVILFVKV